MASLQQIIFKKLRYAAVSSLYIETLLNIGNLGEEADSRLMIPEMSHKIDSYYIAKDAGYPHKKPRPLIHPWFQKVFTQLESRASPRWSEIGCILGYFSPEDQYKLANRMKELRKIVTRTWETNGHMNSIIYSPPENSQYALAIVMYKNDNFEKRYEFLENAANLGLEPEHVAACLTIGINIDQDNSPYHYIALATKNLLET